jgi:SAM-dependent methyltransferase
MMDENKRAFIRGWRETYIDSRCGHPLYRAFVEYLDRAAPYNDDYFRYCNTFAAMVSNGLEFEGKRIRETGHASALTWFLREQGHDAAGTEGDLRYVLKAESASIDLVLSFEVMEHIKDRQEERFDDIVLFNESGVRSFASEIARMLKPGGMLAMTTPNANSLLALERLVNFEPPVLFRPHVREYTRREVVDIFKGLNLLHYETQNSFFYFQKDPEEARQLFDRNDWSPEERGELHFCIFAKP